MPEIILPTTRTKSTKVNPKVLLIYGLPKIGKTSILAGLDNCLILELEKEGVDYVPESMNIQVNSLQHLLDIGKEIKKQNRPYKYIAIDTITQLEEWCEARATQLYKKSPIYNKRLEGEEFTSVVQLPRGSGYAWLRLAFNEAFEFVRDLAPYVILIAHVKETDFVIKTGLDTIGNPVLGEPTKEQVSSFSIDLIGKDKQIAASKATSIAFLYKKVIGAKAGVEESVRVLNFKVGGEVLAGSRVNRLYGKEIVISKKIGEDELGNNIIETYWDSIYLKED